MEGRRKIASLFVARVENLTANAGQPGKLASDYDGFLSPFFHIFYCSRAVLFFIIYSFFSPLPYFHCYNTYTRYTFLRESEGLFS
ncbi:hypothetical protein OROGR_010738 [Orobanche gracilis]